MLPAKDSEVDKVHGLRLGADDYLTSPFLWVNLLQEFNPLVRRYTVFNSGSNKDNHVEKKKELRYDGIKKDK